MKIRNTGLIVAVAVLAVVQALAGGMGQAAAGEAGDAAALAAGNEQFAWDMYGRIAAGDRDKNVFFSPFSVSAALGMTCAGARGETERQMAATMRFALPQEKLHPAFAALLSGLQADAPGYRLSVANALWGQDGFFFRPEFLALTDKYYNGGFKTVDFASRTDDSRRIINGWVADRTAGKIRDLLQDGDLTPLTRLVLTNAIYFKGDWATKFKAADTATAPFRLHDGRTVDARMMHQTGRFGYAAADGVKILELPYAGDEVSMVVLLPDGGLEELETGLAAGRLAGWLGSLEKREVSVFLPSFKITARYGLKPLLSSMGMPDAFSLAADFSGLNGQRDLTITDVIHQAFVEVNEAGSEAAAATAVIIGLKSMPPVDRVVFRADRPFVFLITHKPTGTILFMGRVANPAGK
jgi:serpin B